MKKLTFALLCSLVAAVAFADEKPLACSMRVDALKSDSKMTKDEKGGGTAITRNAKYQAKLTFTNGKPEKAVLKVYFLGVSNGESTIEELQSESYPVEVDEKGRAVVEIASRSFTQKKTKPRGNGRGKGGDKTVTGSRITGCVVQLYVGEKLMKGWASDGRWSKLASKGEFKVENLQPAKK